MNRIAVITIVCVIAAGCQDDRPKATTTDAHNFPGSADLAKAKSPDESQQSVNSDQLQLVAGFWGPMPTGVAVSKTGRIFVNFPRWGDPVEYTVAEVKNGHATPYPNLDINKIDDAHPEKCLVSVQSVVVDEQDRLWILDTGSINMGPHKPNGPKLLCVDLSSNKVVKTIDFKKSPDAIRPTTYLNDIRFDLNRETGGLGFITDSSDSGHNGIIVVDLESGQAWRRLDGHPSTKAQENFAPTVEGELLLARTPGKPDAYPKIGSDGIALSADKKTLFYCPLISRHLYSVSVDALADRNRSDADVAATIKDLGDRGYCSDGLGTDSQGRILLTDYEHNALHARDASGQNDTVLVRDPRIIWPDSMAFGADGFVYFTANQLNRQPRFHNGKDLRQQPYSLFRLPLNAGSRTETAMAR